MDLAMAIAILAALKISDWLSDWFISTSKGRDGKEGEGKGDRKGKGGEEKGREGCPQFGNLAPPVTEGREEKSKEGSLGWVVQALFPL